MLNACYSSSYQIDAVFSKAVDSVVSEISLIFEIYILKRYNITQIVTISRQMLNVLPRLLFSVFSICFLIRSTQEEDSFSKHCSSSSPLRLFFTLSTHLLSPNYSTFFSFYHFSYVFT